MDKELLHILQHSLGVDQYGIGPQYRNRFVTGPGSKDFENCAKLVELGFMKDHGPWQLAGGDHFFSVTSAGVNAMSSASPAPPKLTRGQRRYKEFLDADWFDGSFGDWLKQGCCR